MPILRCSSAAIPRMGPRDIRSVFFRSGRSQRDEALGRGDSASGQPRRRRECRAPADAGRGSLHVEGLRLLERGPQRDVCCAVGATRDDRPSPIFEGEKGFMTLVSGPLDLSLFGGEEGPSGPVPFKILDTYIKRYPVE